MQTPIEITHRASRSSMHSGASRLRVVALTHRVPFPPDKGDKIRTWHLLSRLAQRAEVHLACLADPPEDARYIEGLRDVFASVRIVPIEMRSQKLRALPYVATRTPLTLPVFHHRDLDIEPLVAACERNIEILGPLPRDAGELPPIELPRL